MVSAIGSQRSNVCVPCFLSGLPAPGSASHHLHGVGKEHACQPGQHHSLFSCPRSPSPSAPHTLSPLPPLSVPSSLATATDWSEPGPSSLRVHATPIWSHTGDDVLFAPDASSTLHCPRGQRAVGIGREAGYICWKGGSYPFQ